MPYNPIEYLKSGNVDFVYRLTTYDYNDLIESVRKNPDRLEIVNGFLPHLIENRPCFCFDIIYDMPEFSEVAYDLLHKEENGVSFKHITPELFGNMLNNSPLGKRLLQENFEKFVYALDEDKERSECRTVDDDLQDLVYFIKILEYAFNKKDKDILRKLSRYEDLHIRFLFMDYLITKYPEMIGEIYDDIAKYLTSVTYEPKEQLTFLPKLMKQEDVSKLAVDLLGKRGEEDYEKIKEYILKSYDKNNLASELLDTPFIEIPNMPGAYTKDKKRAELQEKVFSKDSDILFTTSANYRFHILFGYDDKIKSELLNEFARKMRFFLSKTNKDRVSRYDEEYVLNVIERFGFADLLSEWAKKYMDLSKSKKYGYVGGGTTCRCYRVGDYVIKLVKTKWSYEDVICPNLYLIAKNYEEVYARDNSGVVLAGLEVQKYLTRSAKDIDPKYFEYFDKALDRLGYKRTDSLTGGPCGENTMLLDSYRDADCPNPERVPVWFRKYPIVIVDRDRIYPKDQTYVKQLSSGY